VLAITVWIFTSTSGSVTSRLVLVVLSSVPGMVLGGFSGIVADRYSRFTILVCSDLARLAIGVGLAMTAVYGFPTGAIVLVTMGNAAGIFYSSSAFAAVSRIVPEESRSRANGLMETTQWLVRIVGPAVAAISIAYWGASVAFAFDAATFGISAILLWRLGRHWDSKITANDVESIGPTEPEENSQARDSGSRLKTTARDWWGDLVDVSSLIFANRDIRGLLACSYGVAFLTSCTSFGLIFLIVDGLKERASSVGFVYSLNALIALGSSAAATTFLKGRRLNWALALAMAGFALSQLVMGSATSIVVLACGVAISASANAPYNVAMSTLYMNYVPEEFRGRVIGLDTVLENALTIVAFLYAATVLELFGVRWVFFTSGVVLVPFVALAFRLAARRTDS
jgi:MFS family permease